MAILKDAFFNKYSHFQGSLTKEMDGDYKKIRQKQVCREGRDKVGLYCSISSICLPTKFSVSCIERYSADFSQTYLNLYF